MKNFLLFKFICIFFFRKLVVMLVYGGLWLISYDEDFLNWINLFERHLSMRFIMGRNF